MKDPKVTQMTEEIVKSATASLMKIMETSDEGKITEQMLSEAYIAGYADAQLQEIKRLKENN